MNIIAGVTLAIGLAVSFYGAIFALTRKPSYSGGLMIMFTVSIFITNLGFLVEYCATGLGQAWGGELFQRIGKLSVLGFAFLFVCENCECHLKKWHTAVMVTFSVLVALATFLSPKYPLFYREIGFNENAVFGLTVKYGVVFYIYITYAVALLTAIILLEWRKYRITPGQEAKGIRLLSVVPIAIILLLLVYFSGITNHANLSPYTLSVGGLYILFIVSRFRIIDPIQVAQEDILQTIEKPYVVVSASREILYSNTFAKILFPDLKGPTNRFASQIIQELFAHDGQDYAIGEDLYSVEVKPYYNRREIKGYIIWMTDRTEEIARTKHLTELKEEAEEANKNKTEFLTNMSHEFLTPLNAILGMSGLLLREELSPKGRQEAESIQQSAKSLLTLINGMLHYTRPEHSTLEEDLSMILAPKARILVVDDNVTNLKVAKGLFEAYSISIETASSGRECVAKVLSNRYDLLFVDQMMPEMSGVDTARRIRTMENGKYKKLPLVAFSANVLPDARENFLRNGFDDFIPKPLSLENITRMLKRFLAPELIQYVDVSTTIPKNLHIEGVDIRSALAFYNNQPEPYLRMLSYFYEDGDKQIARMDEYIEKDNLKNYLYEVHALKGLAGGVGAITLAELAKQVETECKNEEYDRLKADAELLHRRYADLLAAIEPVLADAGLLNKGEEQPEAIVKKEALPRAELIEKLHKVGDHIDMLEQNEALEILSELREHEMEEVLLPEFAKLSDDLENFEFTLAQENLRNIHILLG